MATVIVQKLRNTLNEESIAKSKVMTHKLKRVQMFLKSFLDKEVILDHLHVLYEVENEIDKFASRVTRQRKRFGVLMNQPFFFNNLDSCRMLRRNMNKILRKISSSSLHSKQGHQICLRTISGSSTSITTTTKSSSAVWPIPTIPISTKGSLTRSLSMIPQKKKLTVTYSDNKRFKEEDIHDQCSDDLFVKDYNGLRIDLKPLLLYLALFPKDEDIPVRRLLRLWVAEGFVKQPFPEDLVQKHFDELVDQRIIQITMLRSDNSPRKCRLVPLLHDYLSPKAQDLGLFYIPRDLEHFDDAAGSFGVRRLVHHMTTTGVLPTTIFDPSLLRSFLSFNRPRKDTSAKEVRPLLGRIIKRGICLLRVLDLEGVNKPTLPENLGQLTLLKYLGLRGTNLDSLPESVGDLSHLETLDVKHTEVSLPDSIWKLKNLRHLNLNNIRLAMPPSSSLTLLTLWGLVLDDKISVNESLGMLLNLQELGIKFQLSTTTQGVLLDWIAKLVKLQSLRLISVDGRSHALELVLKPLVKLVQLSHLNLHGILERLPAANEFPPTVKVLTLSNSQLNNDPMETLEQLPCLMVLRLLKKSFMGKKMVCHRGGFKKLEVLKLWVTELEEWEVEEEAMESLKQIDIRCCHKLKNIPSRLLLKRSLENIILTGMPDDLVTRITNRKAKDTSLTVGQMNELPLR